MNIFLNEILTRIVNLWYCIIAIILRNKTHWYDDKFNNSKYNTNLAK